MKKIIYLIIGVFIVLALGLVLIFQLKDRNLDEEITGQNQKQEIAKKNKLEELLPAKKIKTPEDLYQKYINLPEEKKKELGDRDKEKIATYMRRAFLKRNIMIETAKLYKKNLHSKNKLVHLSALNQLANLYDDSGRDLAVAEEIFKDPYLKTKLDNANGDYILAGRFMFEEANNTIKNPYPSVMIPVWYADRILSGKDKKDWKAYAEIMHPYLIDYESFVLNGYGEKTAPYWTAMSYAAFCKIGEKEYCPVYRENADKFKSTWSILLSAYYYLDVDKNRKKAIQKIKENMDYFKQYTDKNNSSMAVWWNNERKRNGEHDLRYKAIVEMRKLVPEFNDYIISLED